MDNTDIQEGKLVEDPTLVDEFMTPPPPREQGKALTMDFPDAIREIIKGKKVRRLSWESETDHGLLKDGWLTINTKGAFHTWLISDGDMEGNDYISIGGTN